MSGKRKASAARSKGPEQPAWKRRLMKTLKWGGITGLVLTLLGVLTFVILYRSIDIPDPNADFQTETTYVYYADGKTELGRYATQNRNSIPLSEMPDTVKDAVVTAEDRSFWTNRGIDPKGILRAAFSNAQGNDRQGASTITQQYVKILYLTQEQSYKRKIREAVVSLKLHRQQSKEQILEGYLNTIYFGRGAYGIDAAAQAYFGVPAKKLNLRQSAVLASVINNPTLFDPANGKANKNALRSRFQWILGNMGKNGDVSAAQAEKAAKRLPPFPTIKAETTYGGQKGHALTMIRKELLRLGFTDQEINGGGLRVTTTLTKKAMDAASAGVAESRPEGIKGLHIAAASVEPGTGALRGFYGGQDYLQSQLNWAVSGGQPGSTFKAFALAAGISAGYSLKDTFEGNSPFEFAPGQKPVRNLGGGDGTDYGRVNLITATEDSINTAFVDLTMGLPNGPKDVLKMAKAMGIPGDDGSRGLDNLRTSPGLTANPGIALGSATVSPINIANGYATIANDGVRADLFVIERVTDRSGEVKYQHKVTDKRVLDEDVNADVSYALQQVVKAGSGTTARALGRPAGGKTGTATNAEDQVSSSWFVGYTPQLATAVMMVRGTGNESLEEVLPGSYYGGRYPAAMWTSVMSKALEGEEVLPLPDAAWTDGEAPNEDHEYVPPPPPPTNTPKPPKETKTSKEPEPSETATEEPTDEPTVDPTDEPTVDPTESCGLLGCPTPTGGATPAQRKVLPPGRD
ncbi:transglycosylase domain-containing protein [Nocardioides daejeonensis]|uniref:transglycosylase domain-containing protein n=1 Tax=Nocardioides daejeonensis TaxID=1046556 RepID=UPI001EF5C948|nr:transglycosylase domain-containing protein [Nocardioides daejeonensis]